ncbi:MAG: cupin domain-containing protein [Lachnospiraceae bacterium]
MTNKYVFHKDTIANAAGPGVTRRVLAYNDDLMCVENTFLQGAAGPIHSHPHTQITYVIKGEFKFQIGDEVKTVRAGDSMLKTNEVLHGCVCLKEGILLDIFTPMRRDFI